MKKAIDSVSAIVLAGGQSSRMGQDKALITLKGIPLLQQICEIAQKCASKVYVVTSWSDRYQNIVPHDCQFVQEFPLAGETKPQGPLVGFAQGLAQVESEWVLLLACDLPCLRVEVLQEWVRELDTVPEEAIAFLPRHSKGWEPLCGFYRHRCLPLLTDFINRDGRSFQKWLAENTVQELPLSDTKMLFNCNTPNDLTVIE